MEIVTVRSDKNYRPLEKTFASAFRTDPLFAYIYGPDVKERLARNEFFFEQLFSSDSKLPDGKVVAHATADQTSAAYWMPGGAEKSGFWKTIFFIILSFRTFGFAGMLRLMRVWWAVEACQPKERHAYLQFLGTAEGHRGKGTGARVIREMLRKLDLEKIPAYLESSNPENIRFYERQGFKVVGLVPLPTGAPPITRMWRDPQ